MESKMPARSKFTWLALGMFLGYLMAGLFSAGPGESKKAVSDKLNAQTSPGGIAPETVALDKPIAASASVDLTARAPQKTTASPGRTLTPQEQAKKLVKQGKMDAARDQLIQAAEADPSNAQLRQDIAKFYLETMHDEGMALHYLEQTLDTARQAGNGKGEPDQEVLDAIMGLATTSPENDVRERAAKMIQEHAAANPTSDAAQLALGDLEQTRGNMAGALKAYQDAANTGSVDGHIRLGDTHMQQGNYAAAVPEMRAAYQIAQEQAARAGENGENREYFITKEADARFNYTVAQFGSHQRDSSPLTPEVEEHAMALTKQYPQNQIYKNIVDDIQAFKAGLPVKSPLPGTQPPAKK
jgi:tetratricopeptide (TPR) repeat protein